MLENPLDNVAKILPGLERGMNTTESGTMRILRKKDQGAKGIERKILRKLESGIKSITRVRVGERISTSGERIILKQ
jgi:hypothetical protein